MSMWTIVPFLQNSSNLPVTRSSNRTPNASSKSAPSFDLHHRVVEALALFVFAVHRPVGERRAVHAEPAQRERMRFRETAAAHERRRHGNVRGLGEFLAVPPPRRW